MHSDCYSTCSRRKIIASEGALTLLVEFATRIEGEGMRRDNEA
jgi:hypothetical protein